MHKITLIMQMYDLIMHNYVLNRPNYTIYSLNYEKLWSKRHNYAVLQIN